MVLRAEDLMETHNSQSESITSTELKSCPQPISCKYTVHAPAQRNMHGTSSQPNRTVQLRAAPERGLESVWRLYGGERAKGQFYRGKGHNLAMKGRKRTQLSGEGS